MNFVCEMCCFFLVKPEVPMLVHKCAVFLGQVEDGGGDAKGGDAKAWVNL